MSDITIGSSTSNDGVVVINPKASASEVYAARNEALEAKVAAETAQGLSETAQVASETARDSSISSATDSSNSAIQADTSATASAASAVESEAQATSSQQSADDSASYTAANEASALASASSATASANSASNASVSESNASTSADSASVSATNASNSATSATNSASSSASSATTASTEATNSANSATSSSNSATSSSNSASNASNSAAESATSATSSAISATESFNSATSSSDSAASASSSATIATGASSQSKDYRDESEQFADNSEASALRAESVVIPTEATYTYGDIDTNNQLQNKANFIANGHTSKPKEYIETDTPYTMIDPTTDSLIVDGNIVEVVGEELFGSNVVQQSNKSGTIFTLSGNRLEWTSDVSQSNWISFNISDMAGKWVEISYNMLSNEAEKSGIYINGENLYGENGYNSFIILIDDTTEYLEFKNILASTETFEANNISVKEIQPIVLPNAPFDTDTSHTIDGLGEELVVNGTFDTDTSGWSVYSSSTLSHDTGRLKITNTTSWGSAVQSFSTVVGKTYEVSFTTEVGTVGGYVRSINPAQDFSNSTAGSYKATFTATLTTTQIVPTVWSGGVDDYAYFDNISVREVTGLQTTQEVSKGDFVVQGQELHIPNTWDDSVANIDETDSVISYTSPASGSSAVLAYDFTEGEKYIIDFEITAYTSGSIAIRQPENKGVLYNSIGFYSEMFTADSASGAIDKLVLQCQQASTILTLRVDSVKPYNEVYQAIVDTTTGADLTDIALFQTLDRVARQDIVLHRIHKTTLNYDKYSFKGITLFEDTASPVEIMEYYFGSAISKGLWSDDTYYYMPLDVFERFNAGAYHPFLNEFGTEFFRNNTNGGADYWYKNTILLEQNPTIVSVFDFTLIGQNVSNPLGVANVLYGTITHGTVAGRPNDEYYDKVYINQSRDLRLLAYTLDNTTSLRNEARDNENGSAVGVEGMVETKKYISDLANNTVNEYLNLTDIEDKCSIGDTILLLDSTGAIWSSYKVVSIPNTYAVELDRAASKQASNSEFFITQKSPHSFKNFTHTDLIGDPVYYTQILKDRLAQGKGVLINPLLVSDEGDDLIPLYNGTIETFKVSNKLWVELAGQIHDGSGYLSYNLFSDSINNTVNGTFSGTRDFLIANYITKANQTLSLPTGTREATLDKVYSSNSHSLFKGGNAVSSGTGKISTGNGANGYESKYLENCYAVDFSQQCVLGVSMDVAIGEVVYVDSTFTAAIEGMYKWTHTSPLASWTPNISTAFDDPSLWLPISFNSTPSHNTITLDSEDSVASKRFYTLEKDDDDMAVQAMYTTELVSNVSAYDGDSGEFEQLIDGTLTDDNANTIITSRTARRLNYFIGE